MPPAPACVSSCASSSTALPSPASRPALACDRHLISPPRSPSPNSPSPYHLQMRRPAARSTSPAFIPTRDLRSKTKSTPNPARRRELPDGDGVPPDGQSSRIGMAARHIFLHDRL